MTLEERRLQLLLAQLAARKLRALGLDYRPRLPVPPRRDLELTLERHRPKPS